jgi:hypothetical protein
VGMKFFLSVVPVTPDLAQKMTALFIGFSFLAMVGCFARVSSFLAAISGIYVLGIPEFYGKVDHYDHLIWFMFILSASRCADVLSVDSLRQAFREADQGQASNNRNSAEYALPLRFIWLLMGMIYFFPGFWKILRSQALWAWSDNLKYQLYASWFKNGGWLPFFRLDQHPLLYKICGTGTILFELSFVFLILYPALRPMAAIAGVFFHEMAKWLMNIDFLNLQFCYLSFINWAGLFYRIGKWMFKEPMQVRFDGKTRSYRRKIAVLVKFDIFQRIIFTGQIQPLKRPLIEPQILKFTGIALLLINSVFGFREIMPGWPFACYPTFGDIMQEARIETVTPYGVTGNREEPIGLNILKNQMSLSRFIGMINSILAIPDEDRKRTKLKALFSVMKMEGIDLRNYSKIRFYKTIYSTQPEKVNDPPISKELLAEIDT